MVLSTTSRRILRTEIEPDHPVLTMAVVRFMVASFGVCLSPFLDTSFISCGFRFRPALKWPVIVFHLTKNLQDYLAVKEKFKG